MRGLPRVVVLLASCLVALTPHRRPVALADLVYFAKGGEAQLPASADGKTVRLEAPDRVVEFLASDFRKVVPGHWPEDEWPSRRASAASGDVAARFAAAWWALENGLTPQAESLLREIHRADAGHQPSSRMVQALDRLARPRHDPDIEPLRQALGGSCDVARGDHVVVLHQHTEAEARERVAVLDRVVTTYYLLFASHGLELPAPGTRLASAWFARHEDYLAYLRSAKLGVFLSTRGYFHPTLNAVLLYDGRSSGTQRTARDSLAARERELSAMARAIDQLPPRARLRFEVRGEPARLLNRPEARSLLDELRRDSARRELLLDLEWRAVDLGTAAHETVHQLVACSGLAPRHDDFPLWLHEGLAAQFEVVRGGRWAGFGRAHDLRLPDWRAIAHPLPLATFLDASTFARGYHRDLYAQAWALVYYLRKEHPDSFLTFLDLLRSPGPEPTRSKDHAPAAFRRAFGDDLETLSDRWHRYLAAVRTPLDEERGKAPAASDDRPARRD